MSRKSNRRISPATSELIASTGNERDLKHIGYFARAIELVTENDIADDDTIGAVQTFAAAIIERVAQSKAAHLD
jgi:hypothetical protein